MNVKHNAANVNWNLNGKARRMNERSGNDNKDHTANRRGGYKGRVLDKKCKGRFPRRGNDQSKRNG